MRQIDTANLGATYSIEDYQDPRLRIQCAKCGELRDPRDLTDAGVCQEWLICWNPPVEVKP